MNTPTPLWDALKDYLRNDRYPLHVPGHKGGRGLPVDFSGLLVKYDLTELPGLDNLYDPSGPIAEAEGLAARFFGAAETLFTTNGSTAGLIAALLSCCPPGSSIVAPRNAHVSLLSACVLGDLSPVFLDVAVAQGVEVPLGLEPTRVETLLSQGQYSAVVAVSPTYHGVCSDIRAISEVCRRHGVKLVVDEAHGTHLCLNSRGPLPALCSGADVAVQSAHKTGVALTGAAWVHVRDKELAKALRANLRLVQSTSPSYLLLGSLDIARAIMAEKGRQLMEQALSVSSELHSFLPLFQPPQPYEQDPLRLVVDASQYGLSGNGLAAVLAERGVAVELSDLETVTLVLSLADDATTAHRLRSACQGLVLSGGAKQRTTPVLPPLGRPLVSPRAAHFAKKELCPLRDSTGRILASPIASYPPGVPVAWPGQEMTAEIKEYLALQQAQGARLSGISPQGEVQVVAEVEI